MTRVLLVEDDEDLRGVIHMVLEDAGHTMLDAANRTQAIDLLRAAEQPQVVLLDLALPRSSDGAMLRTIQAEPALGRHCYLALTALATDRLRPALRNLVAAVCLEVIGKPFNIDDLLEAVQRANQQLTARSSQ